MNIQTQIRRSKVYSARAIRTLPFAKSLPKKIAFMHMPKCGGTSLSNALYGLVPLHKRVGVIDANATRLAAGIIQNDVMDRLTCHEDLGNSAASFQLREAELITHMCWQTPLIHGHFLWSDRAYFHFQDNYDFVTMLRHPIERAISNIQMNIARGIVGENYSVQDWLDSDLGFHHGSAFLRYFSGKSHIAEKDGHKYLEQAIGNGQNFALIGSIENVSGFSTAFDKRYGARLKLGQYNPAEIAPPVLTTDQRDRLAWLCRFDLEIYERLQNWQGEHA